MRSRQSFRITCGRRSGYLSGNVAKEYFGTILSGHGVLVPVTLAVGRSTVFYVSFVWIEGFFFEILRRDLFSLWMSSLEYSRMVGHETNPMKRIYFEGT